MQTRPLEPFRRLHSYDVAYALGSTIHDGPRTVGTGLPISGLAQGISGYVVADQGGRVHTVVDGEITQVGSLAEIDRSRIVSDDDVVAWVDAADGGTLSVLDLATGERVDTPIDAWAGEARIVQPGSIGEGQASIAAVDGGTVYVNDTRGVMAWDALDGEDPVLLPVTWQRWSAAPGRGPSPGPRRPWERSTGTSGRPSPRRST